MEDHSVIWWMKRNLPYFKRLSGECRNFMNANDLRELIDSLAQDIDFEYRGKVGSICPFNRTDIALFYDDREVTVDSVIAAMEEPFIEGRSLMEICGELIL